jgi:hypothetical protein
MTIPELIAANAQQVALLIAGIGLVSLGGAVASLRARITKLEKTLTDRGVL